MTFNGVPARTSQSMVAPWDTGLGLVGIDRFMMLPLFR